MKDKLVLIEGWRGINHSYAMVNQYQLLELLVLKGVSVFHQDAPFPIRRWNKVDHDPGFPPEMKQAIESIPAALGQAIDTVLKIASPYCRSELPAKKSLTFITAEYGLGAENFPDPIPAVGSFVTGNDRIVTPSRWSKMRLSDYGFPADKIHVVPHGVNPGVFYPQSRDQQIATRHSIGLTADDFVFLNLGAMSINKGIDVLLLAYYEVRKRFPQAKLVLKDDRNLYRLSGADVIARVINAHTHLATDEFLSSIKLLSVTLPVHEMRNLYCLADVYASPYRAEGFNLPAIESIASGTPVIVTAGGATDDFCNDQTAIRVSSARADPVRLGLPLQSHLLEPDLDAMIDAMIRSIVSPRKNLESFEAGRIDLISRFSWSAAVRQLAALF